MMGRIEAVLYVSGEAMPQESLEKLFDLSHIEMCYLLEKMQGQYAERKSGLQIQRFGGMVQMATLPDYADSVRAVLQPPKDVELTQAAMETLSVIAYRQPVTRAEIESVRGVKCDYSVGALVQKRLITEVGRKETLGRPILYGTTEFFLRHFGLTDLSQLPGRDAFLQMQPTDKQIDMLQSLEEEEV